MTAFNRCARPFYVRIVSNKCEPRSLVALRDMLLPRLVSAEVREGQSIKSAKRRL